ncbi:MAG TPA: hypothetical protein VD731_05210 [Nitrosopumilaceae archaeon]|nr:hypothetical protein [Nitrosopumilaceae archaeon]
MALIIIIGITAVLAISITLAGMITQKPFDKVALNETTSKVEIIPEERFHPDAITSGPLTITKYQHKLGENIFIIVNGLGPDEKGNIRIFMPDGRLYSTIQYDGSVKSDFNSYFKPDTSQIRKICEQEELVGRWPVVFDNNVYPPLVFEIINEHLDGPDVRLTKSC